MEIDTQFTHWCFGPGQAGTVYIPGVETVYANNTCTSANYVAYVGGSPRQGSFRVLPGQDFFFAVPTNWDITYLSIVHCLNV